MRRGFVCRARRWGFVAWDGTRAGEGRGVQGPQATRQSTPDVTRSLFFGQLDKKNKTNKRREIKTKRNETTQNRTDIFEEQNE